MNPLHHLFRVETVREKRDEDPAHVAAPAEPKWDSPAFRAPALPTGHQIYRELPFTAHSGPRLRPRN